MYSFLHMVSGWIVDGLGGHGIQVMDYGLWIMELEGATEGVRWHRCE